MIRNYIKGNLIKVLKRLEGEKVVMNEIILTKEIIENLLDKQ